MAAGSLRPCYLLSTYLWSPGDWWVGSGDSMWVSDIFRLHTPPPSVSSPGEACCLSSLCPWVLALGTSTVPHHQAPHGPVPWHGPWHPHLQQTFEQELQMQLRGALHRLHWEETGEGREDPLHYQPLPSNQSSRMSGDCPVTAFRGDQKKVDC